MWISDRSLLCLSSQKKPQRVSLLFEDETEDDEKDSLFGFKPANNNTVASAKVSRLCCCI